MFYLSSANAFHLGLSIIVSFGTELNLEMFDFLPHNLVEKPFENNIGKLYWFDGGMGV